MGVHMGATLQSHSLHSCLRQHSASPSPGLLVYNAGTHALQSHLNAAHTPTTCKPTTPLQAGTRIPSPDLIVYNAGTDVLEGDPLGRCGVTAQGIISRDARVFSHAATQVRAVTASGRPHAIKSWPIILQLHTQVCQQHRSSLLWGCCLAATHSKHPTSSSL